MQAKRRRITSLIEHLQPRLLLSVVSATSQINTPSGTTLSTLISGVTVSGMLSATGQNTFQFSAAADDMIELAMGNTGGDVNPIISVNGPSGTLLLENHSVLLDAGVNIKFTAPTTGIYQVTAGNFEGGGPGTYNLAMAELPGPQGNDPDGGLLPNDETLTGSITGNLHVYTFAASTGAGIQLSACEIDGSDLTTTIDLYGPDGTELASNHSWFLGGGAGIQQIAPSTGTYYAVVRDADGSYNGNYNLTLALLPTSQAPTNNSNPLPNAEEKTGVITHGNLSLYSFDALQGTTINAVMQKVSGDYNFSPQLTLYAPDGTQLQSNHSYIIGGNAQNTITAPSSGTYYLVASDFQNTYNGQFQIEADYTAFVVTPPAIPQNLVATQGAFSDHIQITWDPSPNATSYTLWRNTVPDFASAAQLNSAITSASFDDFNINPSTNYYYWVVANGGVTSDVSNVALGYLASNSFSALIETFAGEMVIGASVKRYDAAGQYIDSVTTDGAGYAKWTSITPATYRFDVFSAGGDFWGTNTFPLASGVTGTTFKQAEPYEADVQVFSGKTNLTGGSVTIGKPLRLSVAVDNPTKAPAHVQVSLTIKVGNSSDSFTAKNVTATVSSAKSKMWNFTYKPAISGLLTSTVVVQTLIGNKLIPTDSLVDAPCISINEKTPHVTLSVSNSVTGLATGEVSVIRPTPVEASLIVQNGSPLWLSVYPTSSAAKLRTDAHSIEGQLASQHLVDPTGSVAYIADFDKPGEGVTVSFNFDFNSLPLTLFDDLATAIGTPNIADLLKVRRSFEAIPAIHNTLADLTPMPSDLISWASAISKAAIDLGEFLVNTTDEKKLISVLGRVGIHVSQQALKNLFRVEGILALLNNIAGEVVYFIQTSGGGPVQVGFSAT